MRRLVLGCVALALASGVVLAPSAAATPAPSPCGFYKSNSDAFYHHCGDTWVWVEIQPAGSADSYEICVAPWWEGWLGTAREITNAWYTRVAVREGGGCADLRKPRK
ncbi:DUF6355 family natural product biosynthesis protein [Streptoalloteichus hindustanus]|nr:DUF6355 family natural product biosynthesis protein [Streptoalloteichus hindustanus]